jgi:hypothetical protein
MLWNKECDELKELNSKRMSDLVYSKVVTMSLKKKVTSRKFVIVVYSKYYRLSREYINLTRNVRERWRLYALDAPMKKMETQK